MAAEFVSAGSNRHWKKNLSLQKNPWGSHDQETFHPDRDFPLRCPDCNRLFSVDFTIEKQCPNCNARFTKRELRDIAIESRQVNTIKTGYNHEMLDALDRLKGPGIVGGSPGEIKVKSVGPAARQLTAQGVRQARAKKKMREAQRNRSHISRTVRKVPIPRQVA